jgi:hypothetical protein
MPNQALLFLAHTSAQKAKVSRLKGPKAKNPKIGISKRKSKV